MSRPDNTETPVPSLPNAHSMLQQHAEAAVLGAAPGLAKNLSASAQPPSYVAQFPEARAGIEREIQRQAESQVRGKALKLSRGTSQTWRRPSKRRSPREPRSCEPAPAWARSQRPPGSWGCEGVERARAGAGAIARAGAGALGGAAADILAPWALAEGVSYAVDQIPKDSYFNTPVQEGEVSFNVDGVPQNAKVFHSVAPRMEVSTERDAAGLQRAYANNATAYDPETSTLYVAGTKNGRDVFDDVTKVPFRDVQRSQRYKDALADYGEHVRAGRPVHRIVGHSLGGAVATELQKRIAQTGHSVHVRTFGSPQLDFGVLPQGGLGSVERLRHPGDPVSMLDRRAKRGPLRAYPHGYHGF